MRKNSMRICVMVLGLMVALRASAAFHEYANKGISHVFTDPAAWSPAGTPAAGDSLQISAIDGNATTWVTNDFVEPIISIDFKGGARNVGKYYTFTFVTREGTDGTGEPTTFRMPDLASDSVYVYSAYPALFNVYDKREGETSGADRRILTLTASDSRKGPFAFTGVNLQLGNLADGSYFARFNEGIFNFGDPNGEKNGVTLTFGTNASDPNYPRAVTFAPGTTLRYDKAVVAVDAAAGYANVAVDFDGMSATGLTSFQMNNGVCNVFGGTSFAVPAATVSRNSVFNADGADTSVSVAGTFTASSGGTVTITNGASVTASPIALSGPGSKFVVSEDCALTNKAACTFGNATADPNPAAVIVNGGVFNSSGSVTLNAHSLIEVNGGEVACPSADGVSMGGGSVTGAVIRVNGGHAQTSRIRMGRNPTAASHSRIELNGGCFTIFGAGYNYINFHQNNTAGAGRHEIVLNGGVLETICVNAGDADKPSDMTDETARAYLTGDGGTLRALGDRKTAAAPFIEAMHNTWCGDGGLTLDTQAYTVYFNHSLENKAGEEGLFRKVGTGTLIFASNASAPAATDVSAIEVAEGTFELADSMTLADTEIRVLPGATFQLADGASLSVPGFAATNATIKLTAGSTITVTEANALALSGITFTWAEIPETVTDVFVAKGPLDEVTQRELRKSVFSGLPADRQADCEFVYDESGDVTTVRMRAKDRSEPLSATATWTGSGAWSTAANWKDGVKPDRDRVAVFGAGADGKDVTVESTATAGALAFSDTGYRLSGAGTVNLDADLGAGSISVSEGEHAVGTKLDILYAGLPVTVAAGSVLTLDGSVTGRPFAKSGAGKLVLGAANAFDAGTTLSLSGGVTQVTASDALGSSPDATVLFDEGQLAFESKDGEDLSVGASLALGGRDVGTGTQTTPLVFNVKSNVEFARFTGEDSTHAGDPIKIGPKRLTLNVRPDSTKDVFVRSNDGNGISGTDLTKIPLVVPEDGSRPTGRYAALTVAEGELRLTSSNPAATLILPHNITVGTPYAAGTVPAELTVDGCTFKMCDTAGSFVGTLNAGYCINEPGYGTGNNPIVRIINGGMLHVCLSVPGYGTIRPGSTVTYALTNGTYRVEGMSYLSRMYNTAYPNVRCRYWMKDSRLEFAHTSHQVYNGGGVEMIADNSVFCGRNGSPLRIVYHRNAQGQHDEGVRFYGDFLFRNGSVFAVSELEDSGQVLLPATFAFDDASWKWADDFGDFTLPVFESGKFIFEMRGTGLVLTPAEGKTFTTLTPFSGAGGLVVDGPGTVAFGAAGTYAFSGVCRVRQGAVDLTDAGTVARATFAGTGTVKGARVTRATVAAALADDWTTEELPVFTDCSIGTLVIDAGRTAENPLVLPDDPRPIQVATWTGASKPRAILRNSGSREVSAAFSWEGDRLMMTPSTAFGLSVIIR